jgi:hypothetical protein
MATDRIKTFGQVQLAIADDRLGAWICRPSATPGPLPAAADIVAALEQARIVVDDAVQERVQQYVALGQAEGGDGPPEIPERYLLAEGRPATEAVDGKFVWDPAHEQAAPPADDDAAIDYFTLNSIKTVDIGTTIGRIEPPQDGATGQDIFGNELVPRRRSGTAVKCGAGLCLGDDGESVVTEVAGRVVLHRDKIRIDEVLQINGDVNFDSGSIDVLVDVHIRGTVQSNFRVRTPKSLTVDKAIEAADVNVDGTITVLGGICGKDQGRRVRAGGLLCLRFGNDADLLSDEGIEFDKELLNCIARTDGVIRSQRGTIIGGETIARQAIEVATIGSDAGVVTRVAVGISPLVLRKVRDLDRGVRECGKSAGKIREKVQPLISNMKRLTPQQREAATELMSKADELEMNGEDMERQRTELLERAKPENPPYIRVHNQIHAGVHLVLDGSEVVINRLIHGPVRIAERLVNNATEVVSVNELTGSETVLPSVDIDLDTLEIEEEPVPAAADKQGASSNADNNQ